MAGSVPGCGSRRAAAAIALFAVACALLCLSPAGGAQTEALRLPGVPAPPDSASVPVAPIESPSDAPASAASVVRLSAGGIRTWTEGAARVFLLEGRPRVDAPGATISGNPMVVWFDEAEAARSGVLRLRIYSENGGAGAISVVEARATLAIEDRALKVYGGPVVSDAMLRASRASAAFAQAQNDGAAAPASPSPAPEPTPAQDMPAEQAPQEMVRISFMPIDEGGYSWTSELRDGVRLLVITGGIEFSFGDYTMRAVNMVLYLPATARGATGEDVSGFQVYAEEDVLFATPMATLEASRLFFDFETRRATFVDASVHALLSRANVPVILRAERVRALAEDRFYASRASVTTCEFPRPHYRVESESVTLVPITDEDGEDSAIVVARNNRLYAGPVPIFWWPRISRDIRDTRLPIRRLSVGNSGQFGTYVYTEWDVYDIFAGNYTDSPVVALSRWSNLSALLDYRAARGTGLGLDFAYDRDDIRGEILGYYIRDSGTDADDFVPPSPNRGRVWWQQRARAAEFQIDTEISWLADRGFLREYYERESKEAKEQETYLYVKRPWEHAQAGLLYRVRLNDFQNQVEYLPQGRFDVVAYPLLDGRLLYSSRTRADNARFRPDEASGLSSYRAHRGDTLHAFDLPLRMGQGFSVTPFTTIRGTWLGDSPADGSTDRFAGSAGAHVGLPALWRVYDAHSGLFDVNRLRHVVNLDFTYENVYKTTREPAELLAFDEVEQVREVQVATARLRQRLQTKRAALEAQEPLRTVDLLLFDVEADYYPDDLRDNFSRRWSTLRYLLRYNVTDDVSVVGDGVYDPYDGQFDKAGVWVRFDYSPRTVWALGNRYIRPLRTSVLTARLDHVVTDRWAVALLAQYDYEEGRMYDTDVILRRNLHNFVFDVYFRYDRGRDETNVGVNLHPLALWAPRRL